MVLDDFLWLLTGGVQVIDFCCFQLLLGKDYLDGRDVWKGIKPPTS